MLLATPSGTRHWVRDIADATDAASCGGKALGLEKLGQAGWAIPPAICVTTDFYRHWLETSGLGRRLADVVAGARAGEGLGGILKDVRARIEATPVPEDLLAVLRHGAARLAGDADGVLVVRSSGVHEDHPSASHAGLHASVVVAGRDSRAVVAAVKTCWASLWTEAAWMHRERHDLSHEAATMAVVIQRFVAAAASGVAFSADPITGDRDAVVIEAGWGAGAALVGGHMTPEAYRVAMSAAAPARVSRRAGRQTTLTMWRDGQEHVLPLDAGRRGRPVLSDTQAIELAGAVKAVERTLGTPVDVEWVFDGRAFLAVQARPITTLAAHSSRTVRRPTR